MLIALESEQIAGLRIRSFLWRKWLHEECLVKVGACFLQYTVLQWSIRVMMSVSF